MGRRILIIQTAFIGDVILATSLLERIHASEPDAEITVLVREGNQSLLQEHPFIREVWTWEKRRAKYSGLFKLMRRIRKQRFDAVINAQRFASTGFLTAFSGAKERIGFDKNPFARFFTRSLKHEISNLGDTPIIHEVQRLQSLYFSEERTDIRPKLYPSPADEERAEGLAQLPFITISPGSVWATKQVPSAVWSALIEQVSCQVFLLGSPQDAVLCSEIAANHAHVKVLAGQLSLLQSAALMRRAVMNYVNDSAPMHLCSAVNAPVAAVFCSTIPAFGFGPLSDQSHVIEAQPAPPCRPCGLHGKKSCPLDHFQCGDIQLNQLLTVLT